MGICVNLIRSWAVCRVCWSCRFQRLQTPPVALVWPPLWTLGFPQSCSSERVWSWSSFGWNPLLSDRSPVGVVGRCGGGDVLPENWVRLLVGVAPIDTTKRRLGERRIYYLQQVRRTPGIFPKAASPQQQNWGSFKLKGTCIFMRGLEKSRIQHRTSINRVQALVDWSHEGQHHHSILQLGGGLSFCRTQRHVIMCIPWGTRTLPQGCTIVSCCSSLVSASPPLRSLITETSSRASIVAKLRSQNSLGKMGSLMSGKPSLFLFLWGLPNLSAYRSLLLSYD